MADWSQLPTELLQLISNRLNSQPYLLRFRSVCSTWRSSTPYPNPNHHHHHHLNLPSKLPLFSNDSNYNDKSKTFSLSKRTIFLIFPPPQNQTLHHHHYHDHDHHPCIIKINNSNNQLLYPLSYHLRLPYFPHLDFIDLSFVELDHEFVLRNDAKLSSLPPKDYFERFFLFRVVIFEIERCVVLLTVHDSGKLAVFRSGDDRWTIVPEMRTLPYDGVCVFKGEPIAVDRTGKTVRVRISVGVGVEPKLGLDLVAEPIFGGLEKYLVESNGELLLVDKHLSCVSDDDDFVVVDDDDDDDDEEEEDNGERAVKFNVYRLDEKEKRWVELTSLGDRTLFLADDCAFSVSASDLGSWYRNCVIFRDNNDLSDKCELDMGVFDLGLRKKRDYYEIPDLFWPPEWMRSR